MCQTADAERETPYVKLMHCPEHGVFHLWVGKATIHLTPRELLLLGGSINAWWSRHPDQLEQIARFDMFSSNTKESS
ncbi:MAG: hypothetical protein AAF078_09045 [Planctomycetota bacterium]